MNSRHICAVALLLLPGIACGRYVSATGDENDGGVKVDASVVDAGAVPSDASELEASMVDVRPKSNYTFELDFDTTPRLKDWTPSPGQTGNVDFSFVTSASAPSPDYAFQLVATWNNSYSSGSIRRPIGSGVLAPEAGSVAVGIACDMWINYADSPTDVGSIIEFRNPGLNGNPDQVSSVALYPAQGQLQIYADGFKGTRLGIPAATWTKVSVAIDKDGQVSLTTGTPPQTLSSLGNKVTSMSSVILGVGYKYNGPSGDFRVLYDSLGCTVTP
jgi:hypothetical protein